MGKAWLCTCQAPLLQANSFPVDVVAFLQSVVPFWIHGPVDHASVNLAGSSRGASKRCIRQARLVTTSCQHLRVFLLVTGLSVKRATNVLVSSLLLDAMCDEIVDRETHVLLRWSVDLFQACAQKPCESFYLIWILGGNVPVLVRIVIEIAEPVLT